MEANKKNLVLLIVSIINIYATKKQSFFCFSARPRLSKTVSLIISFHAKSIEKVFRQNIKSVKSAFLIKIENIFPETVHLFGIPLE